MPEQIVPDSNCIGQGRLLRVERDNLFSIYQTEVYSGCSEDGKSIIEYREKNWNQYSIDVWVLGAIVLWCLVTVYFEKKGFFEVKNKNG